MSRDSTGRALVAGVIASFGFLTTGAASPEPVVRADERAKLQAALEKAPAFADAVRGKKVAASTMVRFKHKADGAAAESDFAETLHFRYDDGKTIRTLYNLTDKTVAKVEALEAYPTPLSDDEVARAKALSEEKDDRVKALLAGQKGNPVVVRALAPVVADKANPRYGKRLAVLVLTPKGKASESVSVTVNLTDQTVARE